jgi:predicted alpha/beta superfamily hydrolase
MIPMLLTPNFRRARAVALPLLATAVLALSPIARAQAPGAPGEPLATIGLSEEFVLRSEITGTDYLIQVAKPLIPSAPGARAPVVYVTDGFTMLSLTSAPARLLPLEGLADPAYVVAIGYAADAFLALGALRQHDLVHVVVENDGRSFGGGGAAFEAFLNDELRPAIEARYPVDHERSILGGHSLGGLFAATVLANDPHSFAGYIIGSPSLHFAPQLTHALREVASRGNGRPVFIASGEREADFGMTRFTEEVEAALSGAGSTFDVRRVIFADETHVSVTGPTMSHGLRHVLSPTTSSSATLFPPSSAE